MTEALRPPLPPFTDDTARHKVRLAEDAWNSRDPDRIALAYSPQSHWRNRAKFLVGRDAIIAFLTRKWAVELDYRLIKEVWAFRADRIAVRLRTRITTRGAIGSGPMAMKIGRSTRPD